MKQDDENLDLEYADELQEGGVFRLMQIIIVLLAVAGFVGLAWYAYKSGETVDEKDVEIIKADKTPIKEAPANPGGMQIPNQDKTVYSLINNGKTDTPNVERILPPPENPIDRNGETETWVSDKAKEKNPLDRNVEKISEAPNVPTPSESDKDIASVAAPQTAKGEQFNPDALKSEVTPEAKPPVGDVAIAPIPVPSPSPLPQVALVKPAPVAPVPVDPIATETPKNVEAPVVLPPADPFSLVEQPVVKKVEKPKATPKTTPTDTGKIRIQLGAYKNQADAEKDWKKISKKYGSRLSGKSHYIVKIAIDGKGTFYRLQAGGFASKEAADKFCSGLSAAGQSCMRARN